METTANDYLELLAEHRKLLRDYSSLVERHAALNHQLAQVTATPADFESRPMHLTESEEDAKHLLDTGLIDKDMYRDLLAQAGFENADIDIE